jgi:asparagine synthase (glutamine-hydrolysing)
MWATGSIKPAHQKKVDSNMCGIAGIVSLKNTPISGIDRRLRVMNDMISHRGPDGEGIWTSPNNGVGLAHRRLAIIDLSETGAQPMVGANGSVLVHNGEVYNFVELRQTLEQNWPFKGTSDTETILAAHEKWGNEAVNHFRGMWSYAIYNPQTNAFFASRDPFGIKPFYYAIVGDILYFASEMKAILPFLPDIETHEDAFADYVAFQFPLSEQTLFKGILQLMPGCTLSVKNGVVTTNRYWSPDYVNKSTKPDHELTEELRSLVDASMELHLRSDVPVGSYVSGGVDSSLIAILSAQQSSENKDMFHGKFTQFPGYDESNYAQLAADKAGGDLHQVDITANDLIDNLSKVIFHLDQPVAGPGSFPQYMVSKLCAEHVKVVLGGQGGDEIFGGYTRYVVGYLEHALGAAIDGTESPTSTPLPLKELVGQLGILREYKPMMRMLSAQGMFGPAASRYYRLAGRSADLQNEIDLNALPMGGVFERFRESFDGPGVSPDAAFDKMTRFDFNWLLPSLLQVEDRMGMAHGLESRVPFLDKPIVEFGAQLPMHMKVGGGHTKSIVRQACNDVLPQALLDRRDKMGFPVPLKEWFGGELRGFLYDHFTSQNASSRPWINQPAILAGLDDIGTFSRKLWGLLSLELWYQEFHDKAAQYKARGAATY